MRFSKVFSSLPHPELREDMWIIAKLASPVFLANASNIGLVIVDNMFLAHLGVEAFAASALAAVWTNATIFLALGLLFGMDTLVSQAYGAKNYELIGIIFQNAMFLISLAGIPVAILWLQTEDIMLLLGQSPGMAAKCAEFTKYMIPGLWPYLIFSCMQRYLQNQEIINPSLIVGVMGFCVNILFNYLFIYTYGLGYIGSPLASSSSRILLPIVLWVYVYTQKLHEKTWFGWSKQMFSWHRIKTYLQFGITSGVMILFEVWGFELTTLSASLMVSEVYLSAHAIAFNWLLLSFIVPLSISIGSSTRVGNLLGEGNAMRAKNAAKAGFFIVLAFMTLNSTLILSLRTLYGLLYTNDPEVLAISNNVLIIAGIACFGDGVQVFLGGVMRGAGVPHAGTVINFIGYYAVAGSLYFILGKWVGWGIYGIWIGLTLGLFCIAMGDSFFIWRIDWQKESINAQTRSEKAPVENESTTLIEREKQENEDDVVELKNFVIEMESELDGESSSTPLKET